MTNPHSDLPSSISDIKTHCENRLSSLSLPPIPDIDALCDALSIAQSRPIHLMKVAMSASEPCGFWITTPQIDFIIVESNTTKLHQQHIIMHELGHLICGHSSGAQLNNDTAAQLFPGLSPQLISDMLMRSNYSSRQEQEAEIMAWLLDERLKNYIPDTSGIANRIRNSLQQSV